MFHSINTIFIPFRSEYNVARQFTIVCNYSLTTFNFSLCVYDTRTKRCKLFLIQEKHKADFFVVSKRSIFGKYFVNFIFSCFPIGFSFFTHFLFAVYVGLFVCLNEKNKVSQ